METVAKCCPSLQEISFVLETPQLPRSAEALWAKSFAGLKKLVTLKLSWSSPFKLVPFFTHLGSSCPNLKQLKMRELFFGLHQQLALVLGPKAELLPHSVKEEMQEAEHFPNLLFQFSTEDVTPICHSLEHLSAKKPKYQANESINGASSSAAFLLRHFSLLKKLNANQNLADVNVGTNIAICGLKELLTVPNQVTKILRRGLEWSLYARPPGNDHYFQYFNINMCNDISTFRSFYRNSKFNVCYCDDQFMDFRINYRNVPTFESPSFYGTMCCSRR